MTEKTESPVKKSLLNCIVCQKADGEVLKLCKCKSRRPVHFECLQTVIISNQSLICRSCQCPYVGIVPVYAKKRISRFFKKYVRIMAYRVIGVPLFLLLLIRVVLYKNRKIHRKEKYFWFIFFGYLILALVFMAIYIYRGIKQINRYNRYNNDIIECELELEKAKNADKNNCD